LVFTLHSFFAGETGTTLVENGGRGAIYNTNPAYTLFELLSEVPNLMIQDLDSPINDVRVSILVTRARRFCQKPQIVTGSRVRHVFAIFSVAVSNLLTQSLAGG
jgi:hypothetical protein